MINKEILKIRKKLDNLDNDLLNIIKKRTLLVNQVLKNVHIIRGRQEVGERLVTGSAQGCVSE